jgi:small conductance mechanosensitive channel
MSTAGFAAQFGAYFSSTGTRVLGSLAVVGVLGVAIHLVHRGGRPLKEHYSARLTEAMQAGVVMVCIVLTVLSLTVIWNVAWAFGRVVEAVSVRRWTAVRALLVVMVVAIAYLLIRLVNRSIDRLAEEHEAITDHQSELAYHLADVGVFVAAAFVVLAVWGVKPSSLFVGAGVLGAVVGLAARETIGAITAGFVLLFSRPFRVGDWIEVEEYEGIVRDVTMVNTKIRTFDDEHVLVPNDEITSNPLVNRSENNRLRVDIEVGVDYATDLDHAMDTAEAAMDDLDELRPVPAPRVVLEQFADSGIVLKLRFWIDDPSARRAWNAKTAVIRSVKAAFDREGISIPFPQRTLAAREDSGFDVSERTPDRAGTAERTESSAATDGGE